MSLATWDRIRTADWLYVTNRGFGNTTELLVLHGELQAHGEIYGQTSHDEIWQLALKLKRQLIAQQKTADAVAKALTP